MVILIWKLARKANFHHKLCVQLSTFHIRIIYNSGRTFTVLSHFYCTALSDNEIDGEDFLELTENIISVVKKMGVAKKIGRLITQVGGLNSHTWIVSQAIGFDSLGG